LFSVALKPSRRRSIAASTGHPDASVPTSYAAFQIGLARSILLRSPGVFIASHKSVRRWTFSQNSGSLPKTRARISAVEAVTFRGRCRVH
jgi:hypothetical protein